MHNVREVAVAVVLAASYWAALLSGPFSAFLSDRFGAVSLLIWGAVCPFAFGFLGYMALGRVLRFPFLVLSVVPLIAFAVLLANPWSGGAGRAELGSEGMALVIIPHVISMALGAQTARIW